MFFEIIKEKPEYIKQSGNRNEIGFVTKALQINGKALKYL